MNLPSTWINQSDDLSTVPRWQIQLHLQLTACVYVFNEPMLVNKHSSYRSTMYKTLGIA